jgi:hypothetical protein
VTARVTYSLPADGSPALQIAMSATTDKATPINMLNHVRVCVCAAGVASAARSQQPSVDANLRCHRILTVYRLLYCRLCCTICTAVLHFRPTST